MKTMKTSNLGRKKSRSYRMKGGAPTPYNYNDGPVNTVILHMNNPYTYFAVNDNGNGTYDFNIPGVPNFTSFCQLYAYYKQNSPKSCVHQRYQVKDIETFRPAPSFIDILGLVLLLMGTKEGAIKTIPLENDKFLKFAFVGLLSVVNRESDCVKQAGDLVVSSFLKEQMVKALTGGKFVPSATVAEIDILPIGSLTKIQIDRLLGLFKQALFFYRYNTLPSINYLTFQSMMSSIDEAKRAFGPSGSTDLVKFDDDRNEPYFIHNSMLYHDTLLNLALAESKQEVPMQQPLEAARAGVADLRKDLYSKLFPPSSSFSFDEFNRAYSSNPELAAIQDEMLALGAEPGERGGLVLNNPRGHEELQTKYEQLRATALTEAQLQALGGSRRTRVKGSANNRRMRVTRVTRVTRRTRKMGKSGKTKRMRRK